MNLSNNTLLQGGKYKIVRFISAGGFGCTYEGVHTMLDTHVAIKEFFVKDFCNRDEQTSHVTVGTQSKVELVQKLRSKFVDEAKALYKMQHPNIVRVLDIFEENGTAYYVMDYIDGQSLHEIVKKRGAIPEYEVLEYVEQISNALKYVHGQNRLHLDIKPGNIMIDNDGVVKLIDFGASKQYDEVDGENTSTLLGKTPGYAPIEQMGNTVRTFTPATDIYALGATMYKCLTGVTPPVATLLVEKGFLSIPTTISLSSRKTIEKAMEINIKNRPQNISEFLNTLYGSENEENTVLEVSENDDKIIDLGLSVKWAKYNLGADTPDSIGFYFAWGEPITKQSYTIDNSITHSGGFFCKSKKNKKWLQDNDFIDIDGKMKKAHDAATNFNGQAWRIPTPSEMQELISRCTWYIGTRNNVPGYKVVGPNGNSIFLPCTGRKDGNKTIDQYSGTYLTSMIPEDDSSGNYAWALYFDDKKHSLKGVKRYFGSVIRPVYIQ